MGRAYRILVVDDEETIRGMLRDLLTANGHEVDEAVDVRSAVQMLRGHEYEVVLTDLMLPDGDGLEVLRVARTRPYDPEVLVITAYGTIDSAVEAVRAGAFDYLTKPLATQKLLLTVERAVERRVLRAEVSSLRREVEERYAQKNLMAASPAMRRVLELIGVVAATDSAILIQGESGTGKELVARAIHYSGARASRHFIAVNCAALPEALLESELFGYVKGAFTGAATDRKGLFEESDGGTLLLDEIGDMPLLLQGKLLRVLQEGEIRRVGSAAVRRVDVRILASTNHNLRDLIRDGSFREDLFYRLNVIPLVIPPLRERPEDIIPLCRHFLTLHAGKLGRQPQTLTPDALQVALQHDWPGNIRELENVIERAVTLSSSPEISAEEFRRILSLGHPAPRPVFASAAVNGRTLQGAEKETIMRALRESGGNRTRAATALGMGRNTLWRKMKRYDIESRG
jgi:DNA-binding NtrC family response regulator